MAIEIRKLIPNDALEYVHFFDTTPHDTNIDEHKCYCVCWASKDSRNEDFFTREKRRKLALEYVSTGKLQGYLAYDGSRLGVIPMKKRNV